MNHTETLREARALGLSVYAPRPQTSPDSEHCQEADLCAMERERNDNKSAKFHAANDRAALAQQIQAAPGQWL